MKRSSVAKYDEVKKKVFQCRAFLGLLQENIFYTFLQKGNIIITVFPKVSDHKAFASFFVLFSQIALTRHWWFTEHSLRGKTKFAQCLGHVVEEKLREEG